MSGILSPALKLQLLAHPEMAVDMTEAMIEDVGWLLVALNVSTCGHEKCLARLVEQAQEGLEDAVDDAMLQAKTTKLDHQRAAEMVEATLARAEKGDEHGK